MELMLTFKTPAIEATLLFPHIPMNQVSLLNQYALCCFFVGFIPHVNDCCWVHLDLSKVKIRYNHSGILIAIGCITHQKEIKIEKTKSSTDGHSSMWGYDIHGTFQYIFTSWIKILQHLTLEITEIVRLSCSFLRQ